MMQIEPKNVLLVEDEQVLRASMVAGLAKLKDVQIFGAATLREAVESLDRRPPRVVVSDIDLPDGLGVQLIGELAKRQIPAAIIFVTAYRAAYGSLIPPHAGVEVLEKPVPLGTLRQAVSLRLGEDDALSSPFTVADFVQLSCMGRHSVTIDVETKEGRGTIEIVDGELWSAADPTGRTGERAFRRLAFRNDVKIQCVASEAAPAARNIDCSWEKVLIDAAREQDEAKRAGRPGVELGASDELDAFTEEPPIELRAGAAGEHDPAPPAQASAPTEDPFDACYDRAIVALMSKDYSTAVAELTGARALRPDDPTVNANLKRLHELGFGTEP